MDRQGCVLCGSPDSTAIQMGVRYDSNLGVHRCKGCNLVFLSPLPTEQEVSDYYSDTYRAEYEGEVSPEGSYQKGIEPARDRVARMVGHLRADSRVLEIGSSAGHFLEAVRPYAAEVVGVEPGVRHAQWAGERLGVKVVNHLKELENQKFDVIALFHTLEHFRDPARYLSELKVHLSDGGIFVVEVPNVDDALLSVYNVPGFAEFYFQKAHLYYFSPETLRRTFALVGAEADVIGIQRYDLSNHLRWMQTGNPGGQEYYGALFPASLKQAYAEALIRSNYADTLWAVARIP